MKTRIYVLALCLLTAPAVAESLAWLPNEAGGRIVLTDEPCKVPKLETSDARAAVSYARNRPLMIGCWGPFKHDASQVIIYWQELDEVTPYPIRDFTSFKGSK